MYQLFDGFSLARRSVVPLTVYLLPVEMLSSLVYDLESQLKIVHATCYVQSSPSRLYIRCVESFTLKTRQVQSQTGKTRHIVVAWCS